MTSFRKPVRRVTENTLGHSFGSDWKRRLVVSLEAGDVVSFRPHGTRRTISAKAEDLYRFVVRCEANKALLEKARARKERKAIRLASLRQQRAEKHLFARQETMQ